MISDFPFLDFSDFRIFHFDILDLWISESKIHVQQAVFNLEGCLRSIVDVWKHMYTTVDNNV